MASLRKAPKLLTPSRAQDFATGLFLQAKQGFEGGVGIFLGHGPEPGPSFRP